MSIGPRETEIVGSWVSVDGRMIEDEASRRIHSLVSNELQHIATATDGWSKLYRDPKDSRYWEVFYPQGEMQGGGPEALRIISREAAQRKYHLTLT